MKTEKKYPYLNYTNYVDSARNFIEILAVEAEKLKQTLVKINFSQAEINIINMFISKTAPILFNMGFPEAIEHATNVARKCAIDAAFMTSDKAEILQAVIVGWFHDPKLQDGEISASNLATHPIIASATAYDVLLQDEMQDILADYFEHDSLKLAHFINGVKEALMINNDSKFVLDMAILKRGQLWFKSAENGICDYVDEQKSKQIREIFYQRFFSPSKGEKPVSVPEDILKEIKNTSFETGLKGIDTYKFKEIIKDVMLASYNHNKVAEALLDGTLPECIQDLFAEKIKEYDAIISPRVDGSALLCHSEEVVHGKIAAKTLVVADQLFLSPHKILKANPLKTAIERIQSYLQSFNDNINSLPYDVQQFNKKWQIDVLLSIVKTLYELTGTKNALFLKEEFKKINNLDKKIETLNEYISNPQNWKSKKGIDYSIISPEDEEFEILFNLLAKNYTEKSETSKYMFGGI